MSESAFRTRLLHSVEALRLLLQRPGFGVGPASIGAELEMCIVDGDGCPLGLNEEIRTTVADPRVTLEVNRFNLELNTSPQAFEGPAFFTLGKQMFELLTALEEEAERRDGHIVTIGILPTLREGDLDRTQMTHADRYERMSEKLRAIRGQPFRIKITGRDVVELASDDLTLEGANTALQIHLRVAPERFGNVYDAANLAIAPVLALAVNSPLLLGCDLWSETRIPLFEQSVDVRHGASHGDPGRCSLGLDWVAGGPDALFHQAVEHYPPLFDELTDEDPLEIVKAGGVPSLAELRLHQSTVWRWNRAVYDPAGEGHVRIEMRALPAGPSMVDMLANSAFLLGLTLGLEPEMESIRSRLTFAQVSHNFYSAAHDGASGLLTWPGANGIQRMEAAALIEQLIPIAKRGLSASGIDHEESDELLRVISERAERRMTGAEWQRITLAAYQTDFDRPTALRKMLIRYVECAGSGRPVAEWPIADAEWSQEHGPSVWQAISPK
ncbi:MAG: glutamate--cysteine ligase [Myxococcota bacterium]